MLLLHFLSLGYDIVKLEGDVSEAREVDYVKQKRLFYYDDFLGQASLGEKLNKNEDQSLLDFLAAIGASQVSKMVLTTREYILNQARQGYEKINRVSFSDETCIVDLSKYTRLIRAQLLFNHIHFSNLPESYKRAILSDRSYAKIVDHRNFSPRIVQLMSDYSRLRDCKPETYVQRFISNLENPLEIWRHAFENQLSPAARNLLLVLSTMPGEVFLEDLAAVFQSYQGDYCKQFCHPLSPHDFKRALKELEGNFITLEKDGSHSIISFHNPSIRDFLHNYLAEDADELRRLLTASFFFDQLMWLWNFQDELRGYRFRAILSGDMREFTQQLIRNIQSPVAGLVRYRHQDGRLEKGHRSCSLEERAEFVAKIAKEDARADVERLLADLLDQIAQRGADKPTDVVYLISLLETLHTTGACSAIVTSDFYDGAKWQLKNQLHHVFYFQFWMQFVKLHPEFVTATDEAEVGRSFQKCIDAPVYETDPDQLRQNADSFSEIGKALHFDVAKKISELQETAKSKEREAKGEVDSNTHGQEGTFEDDCTDSEIDSVFDLLR